MRGKPLIFRVGGQSPRITPADAGKTFVVFNAHCFEQDHPRGCGETFANAELIKLAVGITPADAGKTP